MNSMSNEHLLEDLEKRYQEAMKSGQRWRLSADEFLAAYAMGRRSFYFCTLADLTDANLTRADLTDANLTRANLTRADLTDANLTDANLTDANLTLANLTRADLTDANLTRANLTDANLTRANLTDANLTRADLTDANLTRADLTLANLTLADLTRADLTDANLTRAKGVLDPVKYLEENFEWSEDGLIVYKTFGSQYPPNPNWKIEPGAVLEEVANPCRAVTCACGVNVATREWVAMNGQGAEGEGHDVWKALIRWKWLAGVIVPFGTDGKIRASRVELIEIVESDTPG